MRVHIGPARFRSTVAALALVVVGAGSLAGAVPAEAASTLPLGFTDTIVAASLDTPTAVTFLPDGRALVAEKEGVVKLIDGSTVAPFLDIRAEVNAYWDRGLMGVAADPDFASNGFVYLLYSYDPSHNDATGATTARLVRYTANADRTGADPATAHVLLGNSDLQSCPPTPDPDCVPQDVAGHAVDDVRFASDGTLFVTMGDASSWAFADERALRALDVDQYPGKILRIDREGRGLSTNPFATTDLTAIRSKVWALGFRNPFRLQLRPGDELPFVGDVGWNRFEEVNVARRGGNFGWPCYEGMEQQPLHGVAATCQALYATTPSPVSAPLITWGHSDGNSAVLGPFTPHSSDFPEPFRDGLFYADYGADWIRFAKVHADGTLSGAPLPFASGVGNPVDLEFGPDGDLYYVAIGLGQVRRISYEPSASGPGDEPEIRVSSLAPAQLPINGWGPYEVDTSNGGQAAGDGVPLTIAGVTYEHGLGVHALSDLRYTVPEGCSSFRAVVGIDDEMALGRGSVVFEVWDGTDRRLANTPIVRGDDPVGTVLTADLTGVSTLRLVVTDAGDGINWDHADWAEATFWCGVSDEEPPGDGFPEVEITAPTDTDKFTVGETLELAGRATDAEDGEMPGTKLRWSVQLRHCTPLGCHAHPLVELTGATASFVAPDHEDGTFLRIFLSATDSDGHTTRVARDVHPRVALIRLTSNPPGRQIVYGGQTVTTPFETNAMVGGARTISALSPQNGWEFSSWTDGGAAEHVIRVGPESVTYGATFVVPAVRTIYLSDLTPVGTPINGLGPYERDRSNGTSAAGDGRTLTINGNTYQKGLGTRALSDLRYRVPAGCTTFTAFIGIDDEIASNRGLAAFQVWKGTRKRLLRKTRSGAQGPLRISVPLAGVTTLRLRVTAGPDGTTAGDNGDWADAKLTCARDIAAAFGPASALPAGPHAHSVAAADLNADGRIDIVSANAASDDIRVLLRLANGTYSAVRAYATGDQPKSVAVGDLNADGRPDIVTAEQGTPSGVSVFVGNGDGTFQARRAVSTCAGAHEVTITDLNEDARPDLAVACWGGSVTTVLLGDGTGAFPTRRDVATGTAPHSVVARDFNGDGHIDLATANRGSNNVSVLLGNGDGTFAPHVRYTVGSKPHSLRAGDLDRDGRLDLVVANDASNTVSVLRGAANGTFLAKVDYATGQTPKGVTLADIDRDGRLDVVTANIRGNYPNLVNPGGDSISVLRGRSDGTLAPKVDYAVGVGPFSAAVRDINGDGWVDLLTANWHDGNLTFRPGI